MFCVHHQRVSTTSCLGHGPGIPDTSRMGQSSATSLDFLSGLPGIFGTGRSVGPGNKMFDSSFDAAPLLAKLSVLAVVLWKGLLAQVLVCQPNFKRLWQTCLSRVNVCLRLNCMPLSRTLRIVILPQAKKGEEPRRMSRPSFMAHKRVFHSPGSSDQDSKPFKSPMGGVKHSVQKPFKPAAKSPSA